MKIKEQFLNAFAAKNLNIPDMEISHYRRSYNDFNQVYELETADFDKAIQIMQMNNKKAGIKEFTLLKEEFLTNAAEGKYPEARDYQPDKFVDKIEEVATKRLSDVEKRKVKQQIKSYWDTKKLMENSTNICKLMQSWNKNPAALDETIKRLTAVKQLKVDKQKDIVEWLKTQVDENEATLDGLDKVDWEEFNHLNDSWNEQISDMESIRSY